MRQVLIKAGSAVVTDVPSPDVGSKNILVQVQASCISVGTEMASVKMSGMPLYRRALQQPENVKRVVDMMREQGVARTMDRVSGKLAAGSPTGYSAAGTVIKVGAEVEGFQPGDQVACAGAGIANHAEVIDVPVNLATKCPETVSIEDASTVTLGAIAMQGVRRMEPTLGETILVVGLGILGQLSVQMLVANGCRVIGVDLDPNRIAMGMRFGMLAGIDPSVQDYVARVAALTDGMGADGALVTAASSSNQVISEAMQSCRKKGRVVLVGDVGLDLKRADMYTKELDFRISCSYGPGRYDPVYEEGGQDYPLPYVRWTENRNMAAYLHLIESGKLSLEGFYGDPYPLEQAGAAYDALKQPEKPLMVLLSYNGDATSIDQKRVDLHQPRGGAVEGQIRVALAGASSFAQGVHLPNMVTLRKDYNLHAVMTRTGSNAKAVGSQNEAKYCTTDYSEVLQDPDVDLVMIATRHDLHGQMTLQSLQAGKHTFVEKPLSLDPADLDKIEDFYATTPDAPVLMVGFNRRFAPAISHVQKVLEGRTTPLIVNYRMNAGFIPKDHWVHGAEGGGRNLGEACHIYDLFNAMTGADVVSVHASAITPSGSQWGCNDNFVATVTYSDGSVCSLTYTALGAKAYPKERMDVFVDGQVIAMDDYKSVEIHGGKAKGWSSKTMQKGQLEELKMLAGTLKQGGAWPISLKEQMQATRIAFDVEAQIHSQNKH